MRGAAVDRAVPIGNWHGLLKPNYIGAIACNEMGRCDAEARRSVARHARACSGRPRLSPTNDEDGRDELGHDDEERDGHDLPEMRSPRIILGQPISSKFLLAIFPKSCSTPCIPSSCRGAYASSRYVEAGSGGRECCQVLMRWTIGSSRTFKPCGPGAPMLAPSLDDMTCHQATGANKPVPGESAEQTFNPSRREGRVCPAEPVVPAPCNFSARGPRASVEVRPSLRPRHFRRVLMRAISGADAPREVLVCLRAS